MIKKYRKQLNLTITEASILEELDKNRKDEYTIKEIADKINKDRTTIQKAFNKFMKKNYVLQRQINLDRGFMYVYKINKDFNIFKELLKEKESEVQEIRDYLNMESDTYYAWKENKKLEHIYNDIRMIEICMNNNRDNLVNSKKGKLVKINITELEELK